jgi:hypothetical protein
MPRKREYPVSGQNISRDRAGVIEFPFKILIIAMVLLITIPLILSGLEKYTLAQDYNQTEREMTRIRNAIVQVYSQGENASLVLEVDLPKSLDYMRLGDSLVVQIGQTGQFRINPFSNATYYRMKGGDEVLEFVKYSVRSVPVSNETGAGGLRFGPGKSRIMLTKVFDPRIDTFFIRAEYIANG